MKASYRPHDDFRLLRFYKMSGYGFRLFFALHIPSNLESLGAMGGAANDNIMYKNINIFCLRPTDGNIHSQAMVTGFQNMWGADEATMESLLMIGPVATSVKVEI